MKKVNVDIYDFDFDASRKLRDIKDVLDSVFETMSSSFAGTVSKEYDEGVIDMANMIKDLIEA